MVLTHVDANGFIARGRGIERLHRNFILFIWTALTRVGTAGRVPGVEEMHRAGR